VGRRRVTCTDKSARKEKPKQKKEVTSDDSYRREWAVISMQYQEREHTQEANSMDSRSIQQKGHPAIEDSKQITQKAATCLSLDLEGVKL
jgi:hypothetical protein